MSGEIQDLLCAVLSSREEKNIAQAGCIQENANEMQQQLQLIHQG